MARAIRDKIDKATDKFDDIGHAIDGAEKTAAGATRAAKVLVEELKGLGDPEKKKRTAKACWLFTEATEKGIYPNIVMFRDECAKPWTQRKKRKDGKRRYPGENFLALGIVNAAGIPSEIAEELETEQEKMYLGRVMDLLDIWEVRYLLQDGSGNPKQLSDEERADIDEKILNAIDTAVHDPGSDLVQDIWLALIEAPNSVNGWFESLADVKSNEALQKFADAQVEALAKPMSITRVLWWLGGRIKAKVKKGGNSSCTE